jgi:hypothetical protein
MLFIKYNNITRYYYMKISKIIFQTSLKKPEQYLIDNIKKYINNDWEYIHFNDNEIIEFFTNNPLPEFPCIIEKFNSMPTGAHKADLFRYYFIYIKGGVFIDSDAMIKSNIENIIKDYSFFSVESPVYKGNHTIFQGFIGACKNNDIIYKALKDAYNINIKELSEYYHLLCRNLFYIIKDNTYDFKFVLYNEINLDNIAFIFNSDDELLLVHYFGNKVIPNELQNTVVRTLNKQKENNKHNKYNKITMMTITSILGLSIFGGSVYFLNKNIKKKE